LYVFEAEEILLHFLGGLHGMLETPRSRTLDDSRLSKQLLNRIATKAVRPASSKKLSRSRTATGKLSAGEAAVCSALAELLGIPSNDISPETTIHHLGLDSIGAIQLATKLRAQGFASVTAPIVMKHPGIADLAQTLSSTKDERAVQREVSFDLEGFSKKLLTDSHKRGSPGEDDIAHIWPCTPVQAGLLSRFLQDGIYVNHITYAFNGGIAFDEIHQAFKHLELEFLMLRTGFITHDDFNHPYLMMSYHAGALPLPVTCASSGKLDVNDWRQWNMEKFRRDIARPPWAACVEEQDDRTLMHVSIFHGIYDATSLEIITRRLISYLKGDKRQQAISIGPVLSVILGQALSHEDEHHHAAFWTRTLESSTFNTFPDLTPLHVTGDHASSVESTLNVDMRSLEQRCHLLGWSIHAVGQLAWAQVLSAYLGEDNVCFGLVLSGRDITTEAINIAFPTLVTVPFSMDLVGKTNRELIEGAMAFNSSVHDHQFNRLSDIQRWTKKDALFDTLFAYQKFTSSEDDTTISIVDELSNDEVGLFP
jgi:aryl carrier-like protein